MLLYNRARERERENEFFYDVQKSEVKAKEGIAISYIENHHKLI